MTNNLYLSVSTPVSFLHSNQCANITMPYLHLCNASHAEYSLGEIFFVRLLEDLKWYGQLSLLTLVCPHWPKVNRFLPISRPSHGAVSSVWEVFLSPFVLGFQVMSYMSHPQKTFPHLYFQLYLGLLILFLHGLIITVIIRVSHCLSPSELKPMKRGL